MNIQDFVDQIYNIFKKNAPTSKLQGLLDMAKSKLSDIKYQHLIMGGIYYTIMYGKPEYIDVLTNEYQIGYDVNNVTPIIHSAADQLAQSISNKEKTKLVHRKTLIFKNIWNKYPNLVNNINYLDKRGYTPLQLFESHRKVLSNSDALNWVKNKYDLPDDINTNIHGQVIPHSYPKLV